MQADLPCERCGSCCRWPGEVRLSNEEISRIASLLGLTEADFIEQHTRLRKDRRGLALKTNADHSCSFLDGTSCLIQGAKPQQCRDFPSRWVELLWGKVPREAMRREYPMLFACSAFKTFLSRSEKE